MHLPTELIALAERQCGLLTRAQLLAGGVSREAVRWSVGRATCWALPGVMALQTGHLSARQRLVAAQLFAGPAAQVASFSAVRWHGCGKVPDDRVVRMLVPATSTSRRCGFVLVRRTRRLDPAAWERPPLTLCSPARALIDAARELRSADAARALLIAAVQKRHVSEQALWAELAAGPVRGSASTRAAMRWVGTGAWSPPEADLLVGLAGSRVLPAAWPNPVVKTGKGVLLPTPDAWFDDVGLAVMVHSKQFHARDGDWEGTVESDSIFGEHLVPVLATTPAAIRRDVGAVVARVERVYLKLRTEGRRPDVIARQRGPGVLLTVT